MPPYGRLSREVYHGPPNYDNMEAGDEAEVGLYLTLERLICARAAYPNPDPVREIHRASSQSLLLQVLES